MRGVVTLIVLIGVLWAVDAFGFKGRYSQALWQEANYRGQKLNYEIRYWLNRSGL